MCAISPTGVKQSSASTSNCTVIDSHQFVPPAWVLYVALLFLRALSPPCLHIALLSARFHGVSLLDPDSIFLSLFLLAHPRSLLCICSTRERRERQGRDRERERRKKVATRISQAEHIHTACLWSSPYFLCRRKHHLLGQTLVRFRSSTRFSPPPNLAALSILVGRRTESFPPLPSLSIDPRAKESQRPKTPVQRRPPPPTNPTNQPPSTDRPSSFSLPPRARRHDLLFFSLYLTPCAGVTLVHPALVLLRRLALLLD